MADPVYLSINEFPGTGAPAPTLVDFNFAGGYISPAHVFAEVLNETTFERTPVPITDGNFVTAYRLSLPVSVPTGSTLRVYRNTPKDVPLVDFTTGARVTERNLDLIATQAVFAAAEAADQLAAFGGTAEALEAAAAAAASAAVAGAAAEVAAGEAGAAAGSAEAAALAAVASAEAAAMSAAASADSAEAASNHRSELAAAGGAAGVGFIQAGAGAVARTAESKMRESVSVLDNIDPAILPSLSAGTYTTALDTQIQQKVDFLSSVGGGELIFNSGYTYYFSTIVPKSNVTLVVKPGAVLRQIQPTTSIKTGIYKAAGAGSLSNFHITGGGLVDGQRQASPGNPFNHTIDIALGSGEALNDFSVMGLKLQDAQEDFIRITANHITAQAEKIRVIGNAAVTTSGKRSLGGTSFATAHDLVRIEQIYDYLTAGDGYGNIHFRDIVVAYNQCESIRTAADLKRGAANFAVFGNITKNMYDCHHSVDGSFDGVIFGNVCRTEAAYTGPGTFTNFIEVQGERVSVYGNTGDSGGKLIRGIFVTDYGRPEEGSGRGHVPVSVHAWGNTLTGGFTNNAIEVINGNNCEVFDNDIDGATNYGVVLTSGGSSKAPDGVTALVGSNCYIGRNKVRFTGLGVRLSVPDSTMGPNNVDENGEEFIYVPAGLVLASAFAPWRRESSHNELNPNPWLRLNGAAWPNLEYFEASGGGTYPAVTQAGTRPNNTPGAVVLSDADSGNAIATRCMNYISATQNQRLYVRLFAGPSTSSSFSVLVQEWNGAAFLSNTFYGVSTPASWTEYILQHKVAGATCTNVRVLLVPAASSNNAAATGATTFAHLRISRQAPGAA